MNDEQQGAHEWLIEFSIPPDDLDYFTTLLDHALMSINSDYEAKRYRNLTLDKPMVHQAEHRDFLSMACRKRESWEDRIKCPASPMKEIISKNYLKWMQPCDH